MTASDVAVKRRSGREPGAPPDPALQLEWRADGQLWARSPERHCPVRVQRCFPWSAPGRLVSLRDGDGAEVALVGDIADLDRGSRAALERGLAEAGFVLEIERIESIEEEVEIRSFRVRTRQGRRSFQTARDEWPRAVPGGGLVIRDVAEDLFYIPDPHRLDARSRRLLSAYVD